MNASANRNNCMKLTKSLITSIAFTTLVACGGDGGVLDSVPAPYSLSGQIQKGPLIFGSRIWVSELDSNLNPNGKTYLSQTKDDLGNFRFSSSIGSNLVELLGMGYYMDEITGNLSTAPITLSAIADLTVDASPTINILTTLQAPRIKNLILQGKTYTGAINQSQTEVLSAFGIDSTKIDSLQSLYAMSINGSTDQDSALLAASALLSKMSSISAAANSSSQAAEMSYFLSRIASDIADSGTLTTNSIITARNTASSQLDLSAVRTNVETYYANRGITMTAPKFEEWIDKDNSGVLPRRLVNATGLSFTNLNSVETNLTLTSNSVIVGGIGSGKNAALTVSSGVTIVKNGSALTGRFSSAQDGDTLAFRITSPGFGVTSTANISVGSTSAQWSVTTRTPSIANVWGSGMSVPQTASNQYFAVPISASQSFTAHYAGISTGGTTPVSLSIYSDNSGVPGTALATSNTFGTYFNGTFTKLIGGTTSTFPVIQAHLGSSGVSLQSGSTYWLVVNYGIAVTPGLNDAAGTTVGLGRKMSADGTSWVNWSSTANGNTDNANPNILPGGFVSN